MGKRWLLVLCTVVLGVNVGAVNKEEWSAISMSTISLAIECGTQHDVKEEDIKTAERSLTINGLNPCFLACFLRKFQIIDNNGLFDLKATMETGKTYFKDEDLVKFEKIGKACLAVNDKPVHNGDKECERAKLLFECFLENKGNFISFIPN